MAEAEWAGNYGPCPSPASSPCLPDAHPWAGGVGWRRRNGGKLLILLSLEGCWEHSASWLLGGGCCPGLFQEAKVAKRNNDNDSLSCVHDTQSPLSDRAHLWLCDSPLSELH